MKKFLPFFALFAALPVHVLAQSQPAPVPVVAPAAVVSVTGDEVEEEDENDQDLLGLKKAARKKPVATPAAAANVPVAGTTLLAAPALSMPVMIAIGAAAALAVGVASSGGSSTQHSAVSH